MFDFVAFDEERKDMILGLVKSGLDMIPILETISLRDQESLVNRIHSYLTAATTLLSGHATLHNSLIEHPDFMKLRKFIRSSKGA